MNRVDTAWVTVAHRAFWFVVIRQKIKSSGVWQTRTHARTESKRDFLSEKRGVEHAADLFFRAP